MHAMKWQLPGKYIHVTEIFLLLAMAIAKTVKYCTESITAFDLVTLVQTLQRLQTTTNSVIVVLRFTLFTFCCCKEQYKSSVVRSGFTISFAAYQAWHLYIILYAHYLYAKPCKIRSTAPV